MAPKLDANGRLRVTENQGSADVEELRRSLDRSLAILRKAVSDGSRQLPPGWSEPPAYREYWMKVRYHYPLLTWLARGLIHLYLMITNRSFDAERPYVSPDSITLLRSNTGEMLWQQKAHDLRPADSMFAIHQEVRMDLSRLTANELRRKYRPS
jgi:hypothetical protein